RIGRLLVLGVGLWRLQPGDLFEVLGAQIARQPWLAGVPVVSAILINHNGQSTSAGSAAPPQPGLSRAARRTGCSHYSIACREPDNQGAGAVGSLAVDRPPPENGILSLGMMRRLKATCQLAVQSLRSAFEVMQNNRSICIGRGGSETRPYSSGVQSGTPSP